MGNIWDVFIEYTGIYIYIYLCNQQYQVWVCLQRGCAQTVAFYCLKKWWWMIHHETWRYSMFSDAFAHMFCCCLCPIARAPSWDTEWTVAASGVGRTPLHLDWTPTPCMGWPRSKKGSWNTGRTRNDAWNDTYLRAETVWKGGKLYDLTSFWSVVTRVVSADKVYETLVV